MVYVTLVGAILAEVLGTTAMKYSDGFSRLWPSLITGFSYAIAFVLLAQTLKTMSVGTTYAIWSGVGTAAIAAIGILFIGEAVSAAKIIGILLVILGVVVLYTGGSH
jgi:small multidrug resistance pump